ncbi:hypothetical protein GGR21_001236 [Dysgonomonas hofstadii]|uniref:ABC-2 family transporter protein n=1 Tax=Dysgonomonas hofstadii TaxID=637886 RepID=A0A840CH68_9BACT|nr:hypothetical protein [Dysgonomonas hofstadii]MBB4035347.1 hypothetical protein [Dysgonomonas hofstadii]
MLQALFYKEWCKTKRVILLLFLVFIGVLGYTFINIDQMFRISGAINTWSNIIMKDMSILPQIMTWVPVLAALLLSFAQFIPEMTDKRLKLTLHLPMPENKIMTTMLLYGICTLLTLYILSYIILVIGASIYFPSEIVAGMLWQSIPWFLAGILSYILATWVTLEPTWRQRISNAFIAICFLSFFFITAKSGAYSTFIPYLILVVIISISFPFYSTARFKDGAQ